MKSDYLNLLKQRRTIYNLGKNVSQSPDEIIDLVEQVIKESPTAFNGQSTRAVFLFGKNHDRLWEIVEERLRSEVPSEEAYQNTVNKIENSFRAGFGTILFYKDEDVVKGLQEAAPLYADNFPNWSEQTQGNINLGTWITLAENGIGASLQHYNPLIDELVRKEFDIPENWTLRSQMPFGSIEAPAGEKEYMADEDRFKVFK
ncbi:nitroreductase family protein [Pediococcus argentinicus]|uniref:nitroreductase family protein n=1 Tax=Pediococcus argentinicus TaxID=480391 RepID=UPI00338D51D5